MPKGIIRERSNTMTTQTQNQMENKTTNITQGVHHIGLTVKDLPTTLKFFENVLNVIGSVFR